MKRCSRKRRVKVTQEMIDKIAELSDGIRTRGQIGFMIGVSESVVGIVQNKLDLPRRLPGKWKVRKEKGGWIARDNTRQEGMPQVQGNETQG